MGGAYETFVNSSMRCWNCGEFSAIPNGTYSFLDDVVSAFRGADEDQLRRFRTLAADAASGAISADSAVSQAASIRPEFGRIFKTALAWGIPNLVAPAIAICLAWAAKQSSDQSGNQLHKDLLAVQAENVLVVQELKHLSEIEATSPPPSQKLSKPPTNQSTANAASPTNRHSRRRNAKLSRKP